MPAKKHRQSRPVNRTPKLILEALEPRIAPTVLTADGMLPFTDSNGDHIQVYYDGPEGSQIDVLDTGGGDIGDGDNIGSIEITGSDANSSLRIYNDGFVSGDTPIGGNGAGPGGNGGIFTTEDEDLGELILNVNPDWSSTGPATLTEDAGITIGGELRTLLMSGTIDFDEAGNFITTGGNLGVALFLGDMVLDSDTGLADITAGAAGAGDVGVLMVAGDIHTSTEGPELDPQAMAGATPLVIADDVGNGTVGSLRLQLSGPTPTADVWAVPVPGGGSVLATVELFGEGTGLTVTARGAGGDVGWVWGDEATLGNIWFRGAADTDVGAVENDGGALATVANRTAGGDLLWVGASGGNAEAIATLASGKIGVIFRGAGSEPIAGSEWFRGGVETEGDLGLLSTGVLAGDVGVGGDLTTLRAGSIMHTDLEVGGNAGLIRSDVVFASDMWIDGVLEQMRLGRGGMLDSELQALGGIGSFNSAGAVVNSDIASLYDTGEALVGGMIQQFRAPEMDSVDVYAFAGFGTVTVTGVISDSEFDARHDDPYSDPPTEVGGGIARFQVGGMADESGLAVLMDAGQVSIGRGGMAGDSDVEIGGNLGTFQNQGDMSDVSDLGVGGNLTGSLIVRGSLIDQSSIEISGNATRIQIGGDAHESYITVGQYVEQVLIGGDLVDGGSGIYAGSAGRIQVGAINSSDGIHVEGDVELVQVGNAVGPEDGDGHGGIDIEGSAGIIRVASSLVHVGIFVDGDVEQLQVNGSVLEGSRIDIDGNATRIDIKRDFADSHLDVGGDLDLLGIGGALQNSSIDVDGDATKAVIHEWLGDDGVHVGENLESLVVQTPMESGGDSLYVDGDLSSARFQGITELSAYVGGSVGEFMVNGPTEDLMLGVEGDLTTFSVRGSVSETDLNVGGNADTIQVVGGAQQFGVDIHGMLNTFLVRGSLVNSGEEDGIWVGGGITSFTVTEVVTGYDISTQDWDAEGYPIIGAGIGTFRVGELRDAYVGTHGDIGEFIVQGAVTDSHIDTRAYDDYGEGSLVGGGGIDTFRALGLYDGEVRTAGTITEMLIGRGGIDTYSDIDIYNGGNLDLLRTPGFIFGEIYVTGDVTDILTGGADALPGSEPVDFLFADNHSFPTSGELEVEGDILGTIS